MVYMRQLYKLQLQDIVLKKKKMLRQFEGVDKSQIKGELFGTENLFQYKPEGILTELRIKYGDSKAINDKEDDETMDKQENDDLALDFMDIGEAERLIGEIDEEDGLNLYKVLHSY